MMTIPESTSAEAFNQYVPGRLMAASNGWKNLLVQIYSGPRGRAIGPESFATMHLYLGLPVFNRATEEAFQKPRATHLRDLSGFKDNFCRRCWRDSTKSYHHATEVVLCLSKGSPKVLPG